MAFLLVSSQCLDFSIVIITSFLGQSSVMALLQRLYQSGARIFHPRGTISYPFFTHFAALGRERNQSTWLGWRNKASSRDNYKRPTWGITWSHVTEQSRGMKVRSSVKKLCDGCKVRFRFRFALKPYHEVLVCDVVNQRQQQSHRIYSLLRIQTA